MMMNSYQAANPFWNQTPQAPDDFIALGNGFFDYLRIRQYAPTTIEAYRIHLKLFLQWCLQRGVTLPVRLTQDIIAHYQGHLARCKHPKTGKSFSPGHRRNRLAVVSLFCRWMTQNNHLMYDPTAGMIPLKIPKCIPHNTFTPWEVEKIMQQPDLDTPTGIRDRTIMELVYSSGLRRLEVTRLQINDVHFDRATIFVRGKGNRDRTVPVGRRALYWLERYLTQGRPLFLPVPNQPALFVNKFGEPLHVQTVSLHISNYIHAADLRKSGSCHSLRHTMATLMLENGADIRFIQEILGHAKLCTTQIYTKVSIGRLKEVHQRTHPARMHPTHTAQIQKEIDEISPD